MQEIIRKPLLDHMLFVPGADHKIIKAIVRILFHDMPQNGHTADFDHRFRLELAFFRNARAIAAGKNYNFHIFHSRKPAAEPCLQSRKNCPSHQHFNRRTVWYTPSLFFITMIVYHFHVFSATVPGNLSHLVGLIFIPHFALCYHILTPLLLPLCKQYSLRFFVRILSLPGGPLYISRQNRYNSLVNL